MADETDVLNAYFGPAPAEPAPAAADYGQPYAAEPEPEYEYLDEATGQWLPDSEEDAYDEELDVLDDDADAAWIEGFESGDQFSQEQQAYAAYVEQREQVEDANALGAELIEDACARHDVPNQADYVHQAANQLLGAANRMAFDAGYGEGAFMHPDAAAAVIDMAAEATAGAILAARHLDKLGDLSPEAKAARNQRLLDGYLGVAVQRRT
jgi:hypothetical protein